MKDDDQHILNSKKEIRKHKIHKKATSLVHKNYNKSCSKLYVFSEVSQLLAISKEIP